MPPISIIVAAVAAAVLLVALLLRRRRAGADGDTTSDAVPADTGLDPEQWRRVGTATWLGLLVRGRRVALRLRRDPAVTVLMHRDGGALRVIAGHDSDYDGRPNWDHITALTLAMGQAERCWPGTELHGLLRYSNATVDVAYSPRLVADLEDNTAPCSPA